MQLFTYTIVYIESNWTLGLLGNLVQPLATTCHTQNSHTFTHTTMAEVVDNGI